MTMRSASHAPEDLLHAFAGADYCVQLDSGTCIVRAGRRHARLDEALADHPWSIVTAHNPRGRHSDPDTNTERHRRLLSLVAENRWASYPAVNCDPGGRWPDEPGLMLVDVESESLDALARHFDQAALLRGTPGESARLRLFGPGWPSLLPEWAERAGR